uniref:TAFII55 protein conserved region domain-containing protein n=1 Tax=Timema poppense TaxID=170557 RepID=A0A7R9DCV2_TIMPO|nr:unnamed protein product [Timema poppensis]
MICKNMCLAAVTSDSQHLEEDDQTTTDEESPAKTKKKDPNKVDKKFLWPHGITPPLKNVRRRRFRKTLKKKYVEAPEIEKEVEYWFALFHPPDGFLKYPRPISGQRPSSGNEVKRLLRVDNDAVNVKWEVISEDDEKMKMGGVVVKQEPGLHMGVPGMGENSIDTSNQQSVDVAEHDIFGGAVSDSEEEETNINIMELEDETSRLSADDSRLSDSTSLQTNVSLISQKLPQPTILWLRRASNSAHPKVPSLIASLAKQVMSQDSLERQHHALVTQFHRDMFSSRKALHSPGGGHIKQENTQSDFEGTSGVSHFGTGIKSEMSFDFDILKSELPSAHPDEAPTSPQFGDAGPPMSRGSIQSRLNELEQQLLELRHRRQQQELEIANIENYALRQRFQDILDHLLTEQLEKEQEYQELTSLLQLG